MSQSARVSLEPAWVLHRRPFRDTSEIVDLFTATHGRVAAVARGSRGAKRRIPLEPFQALRVSWSGRGELFTLTGAEAAEPAPRPTGNVLMSLFYLNELLLRLTGKQDPHPGLFDDYGDAVRSLVAGSDQPSCLRRFERQLLDELGYGLSLDTDVDGRPIDSAGVYFYELEHGPRRMGAAASGKLTVSGGTLLAIAAGHFETTEQRSEARRLLTAAIDVYLGGRPLKTRQVLNALRSRSG